VLARGVRWIHTFGTGVNAFPFHLLEGRPLCCARGASAIPISEWALAVMLAAAKNLPDSWIKAPPAQWNIAALGSLHGQTLGLVGLGGIGQAVATRALAFGMRVLAVRRHGGPSPVAGVDMPSSLGAMLELADHVVLAAPSTSATLRMIDDTALAHAKPGLHLVNVARGDLVEHDALRRALDTGRVGLASLDCVDPEPLPAGHWLYTHPRVRLSPHISWSMPGAFELLIAPFIENLRRYRAGEPLAYRVDPAEGY
jgi:phosphoglycerate dehydrogenase-like enzyme